MSEQIFERCPNCEHEVGLIWDVEKEGYAPYCPYCGKTILLCDECMHEYCNNCDWSEESGCKRHPKNPELVLLVDLDRTIAMFDIVPEPEVFLRKNFFFELAPDYHLIQNIHYLKSLRNVEIFVVSAYLTDNEYPLMDKNRWCDLYFKVPEDHRIFVPQGLNKSEFFEKKTGRKIDKNYILIDDYSVNLEDFKNAGGTPIKFMNGFNGTTGSYRGFKLDKEDTDKKCYALAALIEHELHL